MNGRAECATPLARFAGEGNYEPLRGDIGS